jgi:beta-lactamase superfamily II metal-dependent hydrolase
MITVETLPALEGDCLLVNLDDNYILIDSGREETYKTALKSRLLQLYEQKNDVELAILTHIDKDHIGGFISFLSDDEMKIRVKEFWYNAYHHIPSESSAYRRGQRVTFAKKRMAVSDARCLTKLITKKNIPWNSKIGNRAIQQDLHNPIKLGDALIWVISPDTDRLVKLSNEWLKQVSVSQVDSIHDKDELMETDLLHLELPEKIYRGSHEDNEFACFDDLLKLKPEISSSHINDSSIAIIIEYSQKTMLFPGDASQKSLLHVLEEWCNIHRKPPIFDLIKVPHHASYRSTNSEFYKRFKAKNFIISTDGAKYKCHPSVAVLTQIIKNNPHCNIIFNYDNHRGYSFLSNHNNVPSELRYQILLSQITL